MNCDTIRYQSPDYWLRFQYPYWWNNLVAVLDSVSMIGVSPDDPDIKRGVNWLIEHQKPSGLWRLNYSIGAAVLSLVYDIRWDPVQGKFITHSGIESAIELF